MSDPLAVRHLHATAALTSLNRQVEGALTRYLQQAELITLHSSPEHRQTVREVISSTPFRMHQTPLSNTVFLYDSRRLLLRFDAPLLVTPEQNAPAVVLSPQGNRRLRFVVSALRAPAPARASLLTWAASLENLALEHDSPLQVAVVSSGLDLRSAVVQECLATRLPHLTSTFSLHDLPAGTLNTRVTDLTLTTTQLVDRPAILPLNSSSSHRPYLETLRLVPR